MRSLEITQKTKVEERRTTPSARESGCSPAGVGETGGDNETRGLKLTWRFQAGRPGSWVEYYPRQGTQEEKRVWALGRGWVMGPMVGLSLSYMDGPGGGWELEP